MWRHKGISPSFTYFVDTAGNHLFFPHHPISIKSLRALFLLLSLGTFF